MRRNREKISKRIKIPLGTLQHIGESTKEDVKINIIEYNQNIYFNKEVTQVKDIVFKEKESVKWINVIGLKDVSVIQDIGDRFNLHHLLLEEVLNTSLNPRIQTFDKHFFILANLLHYDEMKNEIITEQVSFVLFQNMLITFQECSSDIFDSVIQKMEERLSIRKKQSDYLFYSLFDAAVDNYFIVLEQVADKMDLLEDRIIDHPDKKDLQEIYELKREMIYVRNSIRPLRDIINQLTYNELGFINQQTLYYIKNSYDHIVQIIDTNDTYRDILSGMFDIYFSSIGSKTNEIMKVLTIFSTIFIPLTFLAGIYGMNFIYMPELRWRYSYVVFWIISLSLSVGMIRFFKNKKWF